MKVAVFGLTDLGLVMAAAIASKAFATIGIDLDRALVERLRGGDLPLREPGLAGLVEHGGGLTFSHDPGDLAGCDVVYLAPGPSVDSEGRTDPAALRTLIAQVLDRLSPEAVLVLTGPVPPGFTREIAWPAERRFFQIVTPDPGRAVERAAVPEGFVLGCAEPSRPLPPALAKLLGAFDCPVLPMRYESAELARLSIGMCLAATQSVANAVAELCERMGGDWSEIQPALRLDPAIGPKTWLAPGLGVAGDLGRDLTSVVRLAAMHGADAEVVAAQIVNGRHRRNWAADTVRRLRLDKAGQPLGVWGLTNNANTEAVSDSPALHTLAQFPGARFQVHDPVARQGLLPKALTRVRSPLQALEGAGALLILTPWSDYRAIAPEAIADQLAGSDIIDPYRVLDRAAVRASGLQHHVLGAGDA